MIKIIMIGMMLFVGMAFANPVPTATFDNETCLITVHPNGNALDGWFICVTNGQFVGLHHESETVNCDVVIDEFPAGPIKTVDMAPFLDCGIATPIDEQTWGTMKSQYR